MLLIIGLCREYGLFKVAFEFVAVNDLTSPEVLAHLLKYDSIHGRFPADVRPVKGGIKIGSRTLKVLSEADPERLPWKKGSMMQSRRWPR